MKENVDHRQMIENIPMVTMRLFYEDGIWKTWFVSQNIEKYGYSRQEFMDGDTTWADMVHPDDRDLAAKLAHNYMERDLDDFRLKYRIVTKDGEDVWVTELSHVNRNPDDSAHSVDTVLINTMDSHDVLSDHVARQVILNDILLRLHDADLDMALQIILDRAGAYLDISRAFLFMDFPDHKSCRVVYEWTNKGAASVKDRGSALVYADDIPEIHAALQNTGFILINAGEMPERSGERLEREGIVAAAMFAVYLHGEYHGFIAFDDCVFSRAWDDDTAGFLKNIANLISTVLMRKHTEEQLHFTQRTCQTVLDNIDSYIYAANPDDNSIVFANSAFRRVFGGDCIGGDAEDYIPLAGAEKCCEASAKTKENGLVTYEVFLPSTGQWLAATRELVPWVDGRTVHLVNCHDITANKEFEERITRIAFQDHLTGLPNRYRCDADLKQSIEDSRRTGRTGHLLFIDLDDFKIVNDSYGHDYGDGVLVSFADYLRELFLDNNHVYRFGGDEFVIIVNQSDDEQIHGFLAEMIERAKKPWASLGKEFYCSLSVGVVRFPDDGEDPTSLLKKADIALYQAKKTGKNNYARYTEGLDSATVERSEMEALLRSGMENNCEGFEVHYQLYSETTGEIKGAEALVRMRAPDGRLILPEQFISLAEYLGIIGPLGEFVMADAAAQCRAINDSGMPEFSVTINLSARQFKQKDIVRRLEAILRDSGVKFENIIVAINEGDAIGELNRMLKLCGELREKGVRVALDNFGSGSSSFINMRSLPVDIIRVSSEYVDEIEDKFTGYFLRLVTDLSHHTGKTVCMNGVETREQFDYCERIGIDQVQGFLLHRPEEIDGIKALLREGRPRLLLSHPPVVPPSP